jgi:hypothetical protein
MDRFLVCGWLFLAFIWTWRLTGPAGHEPNHPLHGEQAVHADLPLKRVTLGPTKLRYFEGENSLILVAEMGSDRAGGFYIVYRPGPARWSRRMPEWSRHRREEILPEIYRLTAHERIKWVDED